MASRRSPSFVDERVARIGAAQVAALAVLALVARWWWVAPLLALGFLGRVSGGARRSLAGQLALRVAPRFGARRPVPAPLAILVVAAGLEAIVGFCVGCRVFAVLMRVGIVPREVCERCVADPDRGMGAAQLPS